MVGAGVLILALVIVGPMILDGRSGEVPEEAVPGQRSEELRTHTFQLNDTASSSTRLPQAPQSPSLPAENPPAVAPPAAPPVAAPVAASAGATVAAAPPAPKPASVPAEPPSTPASASSPVSGSWLVQVGTFGQKGNADRLTTSLKQRGFAAFVSSAARSGKTLYRVRVGPAGSREDAAAIAGRLAAAGQTGQVVAQ